MWNPESWALESRIHLKESRIPLMIEIQNPGFTYKEWKPVTAIRNPWHGIENSRVSWIPLHEATLVIGHLHVGVILLLQPGSFRVLLSCAN